VGFLSLPDKWRDEDDHGMNDENPQRWLGPRELNPAERFRVRFAFASKAALYIIAGGIIYGLGVVALDHILGVWLLP
jgi:hypothetical protein